MKRAILSLLFIISFICIFPQFTDAATDRQPKTIKGKVRNEDSSVAKNLQVHITCASTTLTAKTTIAGNYQVVFPLNTCQQFDTVTVSAEKDGATGSISKTVTFALTQELADITLVTAAVAEYTALSAIMAVAISWAFHSKYLKPSLKASGHS